MHVPADPGTWTPHVYVELFFYVGLAATLGILALLALRLFRD
jgi:hypothetical protein